MTPATPTTPAVSASPWGAGSPTTRCAAIIAGVRWRLGLVGLAQALLVTTTIALTLALPMLVTAWWTPYWHRPSIAAAAIGLGLIAGLIRGLMAWPGAVGAARVADRRVGLDYQLATAAEILHTPPERPDLADHPFANALCHQVCCQLRDRPPPLGCLWSLGGTWPRAAATAAFALVFATFVPPEIFAPSGPPLATVGDLAQRFQAHADRLTSAAGDPTSDPSGPSSPDAPHADVLRNAIAALRDAAHQLQRPQAPDSTEITVLRLALSDKLRDALADLATRDMPAPLKALWQARLAQALADAKPTSPQLSTAEPQSSPAPRLGAAAKAAASPANSASNAPTPPSSVNGQDVIATTSPNGSPASLTHSPRPAGPPLSPAGFEALWREALSRATTTVSADDPDAATIPADQRALVRRFRQ